MKKIIILVAVIITATVSQAASFIWKTSGIKAVEGSATFTGLAVLTAYAAGTDTIIGTWEQTITDGKVNNSAGGYTFASDAFDSGSKYDFVFVAKATVNGIDYEWTSTKKTTTAQATSSPSLSWFGGNHTTGEGINANGWQTAAVPEPTSAMLLVLGVAALALRRKQK